MSAARKQKIKCSIALRNYTSSAVPKMMMIMKYDNDF